MKVKELKDLLDKVDDDFDIEVLDYELELNEVASFIVEIGTRKVILNG